MLLLLTTALGTDRQLWRIGRVEGEPKGGEGTHTSLAWDPPHRCPFGLAVLEGGVGKPDLPGKLRAPASLCPRPTAPLQGLNQEAERSSGAQGLRPARCPWSSETSLPEDASPMERRPCRVGAMCHVGGGVAAPQTPTHPWFPDLITEVLSAVYGVFALTT